ncbi:hypothetical protein ACFLS9_01195 [Bacteroidota bacterium]
MSAGAVLAIFIVVGAIFGGFCAFIAKEKNRDSAAWFFLGLLFSLIALIAIAVVPKLEKQMGSKESTETKKPTIRKKPGYPPEEIK